MLTDQASTSFAGGLHAHSGNRALPARQSARQTGWRRTLRCDPRGGLYDHVSGAGAGSPIKPLPRTHTAISARLYHLSGEERYKEMALATPRAFAAEYRNYGY